tara:strand:+ start:817 stop:1242 length:426 start_codon:yes stop_codon:yes gene_type:complete
MKAKTWGNYYQSIREKCPWAMYSWSMGKSLHVPFKSYSHIVNNEQILTPMKLWAIVYEYTGFKVVNDDIVEEVSAWCNERSKEQDNIQYFFNYNKEIPVPIIIQHRKDILKLAKDGKLDNLIYNTRDPDNYINGMPYQLEE